MLCGLWPWFDHYDYVHDHYNGHSDLSLDHYNNNDYQHKYDIRYVIIIWSSQFIAVNLSSIQICLHHQCHHYNDNGHDHSDQGHDHSDQS